MVQMGISAATSECRMCLRDAQESFLTVSYVNFTYQLAEYSDLDYRGHATSINA